MKNTTWRLKNGNRFRCQRIDNKGWVLFSVSYANGKLDLPGARVEMGESPMKALNRDC